MDSSILTSAVLSAALVFLLLKAQEYYRIWRWKKSRKSPPAMPIDESTKGLVTGAAQARSCGRCGAVVTKFYEYADGDAWCVRCDEVEA